MYLTQEAISLTSWASLCMLFILTFHVINNKKETSALLRNLKWRQLQQTSNHQITWQLKYSSSKSDCYIYVWYMHMTRRILVRGQDKVVTFCEYVPTAELSKTAESVLVSALFSPVLRSRTAGHIAVGGRMCSRYGPKSHSGLTWDAHLLCSWNKFMMIKYDKSGHRTTCSTIRGLIK